MKLHRSVAQKLRDPNWWASNQGTIAGIFIAVGFAACIVFLAHLIVAVVLSIFATLGFSHWHWWLGFGFFGLTLGVCAKGEGEGVEPRRRQVIPLPAPPERIRAMGGGNARVTAEDRWGNAA